jgi:gliding motility-associated lipoprotein GldB
MNVIKYSLVLFFLLNLPSCGKKNNEEIDISNIEAKTELIRFDQKFYTSGPEDLGKLKSEFPYLFPEPNPDSIWTNKMKDGDELFLYSSVQNTFGDFSSEKEGLTDLFRHVKYYYPKFKAPKTITILSNVDYNNKVVYADSLLFISLDVYLGKEHEVYQDYPNYIKQNFTKDHMLVDVAEQLSLPILRPSATNSFISRIVQEGKKLYLTAAFLPDLAEAEVIGYNEEQFQWAQISESDIWKYFIQNEMLYSNDPNLSERFIHEAPFSKFYLEVDKDSPGRIGTWFGWQIVSSFMENNNLSLQEMIVTDNEEIFKRSKYKPKKN